jgi:hypothetical protein
MGPAHTDKPFLNGKIPTVNILGNELPSTHAGIIKELHHRSNALWFAIEAMKMPVNYAGTCRPVYQPGQKQEPLKITVLDQEYQNIINSSLGDSYVSDSSEESISDSYISEDKGESRQRLQESGGLVPRSKPKNTIG